MKTTAAIITTYNRKNSLCKLIQAIAKDFNKIYIIDDCSNYDVRETIRSLKLPPKFYPGIIIQRTPTHNGKKKYYKTVSQLFKMIRGTNYDYYFMIPDDMLPVKGWKKTAIEAWEAIQHPAKICLNLYSEKSRFLKPCWTQFQPRLIDDKIILSQWMDLCFISEKKIFDILAYQIPEPQIDWKANPNMSSGVGRSITRTLNGNELLLFQIVRSLFIPQAEAIESQMNKNQRILNPEINQPIQLSKKRIAGIASLAAREKLLEKTVKSLLPQVDQINISLNNYTQIPKFCKHPKINAKLTDNKIGDSYKFTGANQESAYFFTCDDDLIYPPNYCSYLISQIIKNQYRAIVSLHGRIMKPKPIAHYYKDHTHRIHCLHDYQNTTLIDVPGSGVAAWHTDFLKIEITKIITPNMGDIWLAKFAKQQQIPIFAIPHQKDFLTYLHPLQTIYDDHHQNDAVQTMLYNSEILNQK